MFTKNFVHVLQCFVIVILSSICVGDQFQVFAEKLRVKSLYEKAKHLITNSRRYTGNDCETNDDCAAPRTCQSITGIGVICVDERYYVCDTSNDCLKGDRCTIIPGQVEKWCVSCNFDLSEYDATPFDDGKCVCVAIESLTQFDKSSLVFDTHQRASVLCDDYGNCATPGHMVIYKTKPMSMATYCSQDSVSCRRTVKFVNSPKMKIGLRFSSFSKDLDFTALAAAKETRLEETALKWAVSIGI